jgi:hypothetical protein
MVGTLGGYVQLSHPPFAEWNQEQKDQMDREVNME